MESEKWEARIDECGFDVVEQNSGFGIVCLGSVSELREADYPIERAEANAKLIAAAPELLEACLSMIKAFNDAPKSWLMTEDVMQAESIMKDAINKAIC